MKMHEQNSANIDVVRQVKTIMITKARNVRMFSRKSATKGTARTIGKATNEVSTVETRSPESNLPQRICQGVIVVVNNKSKVSRSRSLVTLPAEKTGPIRILKTIT